MNDAINPDHYKRLPAEAIDIIEAAIANAPSNEDAFLHGQVLKYVLRCWDKNGIEDLKKAKWFLDRLIGSFGEHENQKAADLQSLKDHPFGKPKWTPKVGDWVKIKKTGNLMGWMVDMDKYQDKIVQVEAIDKKAIIHDEWAFCFEWLEPAKAPLNSDIIPEGYRKLGDSSNEPRQPGDLRWSVAERRYIEISTDEIGYANRDNWAACRKITGEATGEVTGEVKPPDGWRYLEIGEVVRKGDIRFKDGLIYAIEPIMIGMTCQDHWMPVIRRNRFEVGDKVVYTIDNTVWTFTSEIDDGPRFPKSAWVTRVTGLGKMSQRTCVNHLAPYIEEAK